MSAPDLLDLRGWTLRPPHLILEIGSFVCRAWNTGWAVRCWTGGRAPECVLLARGTTRSLVDSVDAVDAWLEAAT